MEVPQPSRTVTTGLSKEDEAVLAYFSRRPQCERGVITAKPKVVTDAERIAELEAELKSTRAEAAALAKEKTDAERRVVELEMALAQERNMREAAEGECRRLQEENVRLRNEFEAEATSTPLRENSEREEVDPLDEETVRHDQDILLQPPDVDEVFDGEIREHVLAALAEALDAAERSRRERRSSILSQVLSANPSNGELERRRRELRQTIKDADSFVDARTLAELEMLGFKCVSGKKHWKLDFAGVRLPISKTPSDHRASINTATDLANRCF